MVLEYICTYLATLKLGLQEMYFIQGSETFPTYLIACYQFASRQFQMKQQPQFFGNGDVTIRGRKSRAVVNIVKRSRTRLLCQSSASQTDLTMISSVK